MEHPKQIFLIDLELVELATTRRRYADMPEHAERIDQKHRELDEERMRMRAKLTPPEDQELERMHATFREMTNAEND
jgi:hypothetical protein